MITVKAADDDDRQLSWEMLAASGLMQPTYWLFQTFQSVQKTRRPKTQSFALSCTCQNENEQSNCLLKFKWKMFVFLPNLPLFSNLQILFQTDWKAKYKNKRICFIFPSPIFFRDKFIFWKAQCGQANLMRLGSNHLARHDVYLFGWKPSLNWIVL